MDNKQLKLSQDEMRNLGYQVIDLIVSHFENLSDKPVTNSIRPAQGIDLIHEPLPKSASSPEDVLNKLSQDVLSNMMHLDHPRFFGWVSSPSNFVSVMGDLLASGFNSFSGIWMLSSGPAQVELTTLEWLKQILCLPSHAGGIFVSGGSVANLTALSVARNIKLKDNCENAVIYCSDQTHSSIDRALKILGFKETQIKKIPSNVRFQIDLKILKEEIKKDKNIGKIPFCIVANAGSTNTGSIDPMAKIHQICNDENIWMHVDGAYGAAAILNKKTKRKLTGMELADSLTIDPHKWLFQPYEIGCVFIKNAEWLKNTFYIMPEYLQDTDDDQAEEVNFCNRGIQLTRGFRALKLWMSIKVFGIDAFSKAISHGIHLAEYAESRVRQLKNWEVVSKAQLGILTFRFAPAHLSQEVADVINKTISNQLIKEKFAILSTSTINGKLVMRMCIINPRTTKKDIEETISKLNIIGDRIDDLIKALDFEKEFDIALNNSFKELKEISHRLENFHEMVEEVLKKEAKL